MDDAVLDWRIECVAGGCLSGSVPTVPTLGRRLGASETVPRPSVRPLMLLLPTVGGSMVRSYDCITQALIGSSPWWTSLQQHRWDPWDMQSWSFIAINSPMS